MTDIKELEFEGEVVARNASDKVLEKKDGGTYHIHSFVVKVRSVGRRGEEFDEIAFKTVQTDVVNSFQVGNVVNVKCSLSSRPWINKETKEYVLKEDKFNGAELFTCFSDFYAYGVDLISDSVNKEDVQSGNAGFEKQMSSSTPPPPGEDDLPF